MALPRTTTLAIRSRSILAITITDHDADHCAACRHLAQSVTHQFAIISLPTAEQVALVSPRLQSLERSQSAHDYLSRGPPAIAL
jgi:hypothetical protein